MAVLLHVNPPSNGYAGGSGRSLWTRRGWEEDGWLILSLSPTTTDDATAARSLSSSRQYRASSAVHGGQVQRCRRRCEGLWWLEWWRPGWTAHHGPGRAEVHYDNNSSPESLWRLPKRTALMAFRLTESGACIRNRQQYSINTVWLPQENLKFIISLMQCDLTLPMMRLPSSPAQGCKDLWKPSKPCHVGIHWTALAHSVLSDEYPCARVLVIFQVFYIIFQRSNYSHPQHKGY